MPGRAGARPGPAGGSAVLLDTQDRSPGLFPWPVVEPWGAPAWTTATHPEEIAWPARAGRDLQPAALDLLGGWGERALAVDGAGMVWVDGPWQVARVDPRTGAGQVWDAADDPAFARVRALAPSRTAGVWLLEDEGVRLFDGRRFAVDLAVPAAYRGAGALTAVVERGAQVWVGSAAGVARWADGQWSMVRLGEVTAVTAMAVDASGSVWAAADFTAPEDRRSGVVRLDGGRWVVPDASLPSMQVSEVIADPRGGVLIRSGSRSPRVLRFDGAGWADLSAGLLDTGIGGLVEHALAVGASGEVWVRGPLGVAARARGGGWRAVVRLGSPPPGTADPPGGAIVVAGGRVVLTDRLGLRVLAGSLEGMRATPLWQDPAVPLGAVGVEAAEVPSGLTAVSADEAWLNQMWGWRWTAPGSATIRVQGRRWRVALPPRPETPGWLVDVLPEGSLDGAVAASDGALWGFTGAGLVRFADQRWQVVAGQWSWRLAPITPGAGGSVWAVVRGFGGSDPWRAVRFGPDGARSTVPGPDSGAAPDGLVEGADGVLWAVWEWPADALPDQVRVLRWDGSWEQVPPLAEPYDVAGVAAGVDGAVWLSLATRGSGHPGALARVRDGRWTVMRGGMQGIRAFGARLCGVVGQRWSPADDQSPTTAIACVDQSGHVERHVLAAPTAEVDIAADGTVWVVGEQLARLHHRVA
jgi:hypothetical protein